MIPALNFAKYKIINAFFPRNISCAICGQDIDIAANKELLCKTCQQATPKTPVCRTDIPAVDNLRAPYVYDGAIRELVQSFKYNNKRYLSHFFALQMASLITSEQQNFEVSQFYLCAVPLHKRRKKERGFSQTEALCEELSLLLHLPMISSALTRNRYTPSQTKLSLQERRENLSNAFTCSDSVRNKPILLIDDIATSGSTLHECAKALKSSGALQIVALTFASTDKNHQNTGS